MSDRESELAMLLSEALDLCVRAHNLDEAIEQTFTERPDRVGTRSGTPGLWVMDQYDKDLVDWEKRARKALS